MTDHIFDKIFVVENECDYCDEETKNFIFHNEKKEKYVYLCFKCCRRYSD